MEQRALLLVNPMAGRQKIRGELIYVVDALTKAGYETVIYTTQTDRKLMEKIYDRSDGRFDRVICCGGDGTFNDVLASTMEWKNKPVLGYIPAGTTNDFAAGLKLSGDIRTAIKNIIHGNPVTLDAGRFNGDWFSYVASFGAFTETSYSTPQNYKNALGHLAYILEGIKEIPAFTAYPIHIEADGQIYDDSYIFGAVSNSKSIGGILKMNDSMVDLNDGLLEVMMIRMPKTVLDLSVIFTSLTTARYDPSMFVFFHTSKLSIRSQTELVWSLDGERTEGGCSADIICIKDAFQIVTA